MPLDPQAHKLQEMVNASGALPVYRLSVAAARQGLYSILPFQMVSEPVAKIENRLLPSTRAPIPVRIYTPEGTGPFPIVIFFHGGGWVLGNLDIFDSLCRTITNAANCITVAVDYPLAPEHKFPVAIEESYAATCYIFENCTTWNGDPSRIALWGSSAGGNIAAVVALMARDKNAPPLVYQVLVCPVTDHYTAGMPSYEECAEGYFLDRKSMIWFWDHYLTDVQYAIHPYAAPLRAPDLHALPPALVISAEFDPLRDEGERYATRLRSAGVPVTATRYNGMMHDFIAMAGVLDQGQRALSQIATALRKAFNRGE